MTSFSVPYPLDLTTFPGVDDLNRAFAALQEIAPALVSSSVIGQSRNGESIRSYTIGTGSRHAVVAGGVHPNEPIGFHTALHLAHRLVSSDELREGIDVTWHIVPCIDPDGTRLNEAWFSNPGDRVFYGRNFYRPAPDEQVEWSFPLDYKKLKFDRPIPETQALMRLFDHVDPVLFVGLHNAELGGVFYYLNRTDASDLVADLSRIPGRHGLTLDIGEPESADIVALSDGVYLMPHATDSYDYLERMGLHPEAAFGGGGSVDYLRDRDTLVLVAELPYWSHPWSTDPTPTDRAYAQVLDDKATAFDEMNETLSSVLDRVGELLTIESPMLRAVRAFVPMFRTLAEGEHARAADVDPQRRATRAEAFSNEDIVHCFRLRYGGSLLRALDVECGAGVADDRVRLERDEFATIYQGWGRESAEVPIEVIPIENLVGVQLDAIIAGITWVARR